MNPTKEELALSIDEAEWNWLRAHLERGGLILVDDRLDLAETALKIATDDVLNLQEWIGTGMIGKPSGDQIKLWDIEKHKKFSMLIVSPYVLIQQKIPTLH